MSKKVVLSGYYGFDNFGDDAILSVLCEKLKSLDSEITVLSANPQKTKSELSVNSIKNFDIKKVLRVISTSDVLISGGGSLFQDVTSLKSLIYYSAIVFAALLMRKEVLIFAQGVGPLKRGISRFIVKNLFRHAKFVSVRDEKSLELMSEWHIPAKLVNDPVFSVKIKEVPKNFAIGVQLRDFHNMNDEFLNSFVDALISFFPNHVIELFIFQKTLDEDVCLRFEKILKTKQPDVKTKLIYYTNQNQIYKSIAQLEYLFAMRFHAVVAALKAGVKTAAINYDIKVEKLAEEASIPLVSLNASENDFAEISKKIKTLNSGKLSSFANSKTFDWAEFENFLI